MLRRRIGDNAEQLVGADQVGQERVANHKGQAEEERVLGDLFRKFRGGPWRAGQRPLLVGVASGTYSSIFTAAPLLVVWNKGEWGRFIGRKPETQQTM